MSHTTTLKGVQIKDISALRSAVAELQRQGARCELVEDAKPRMYFADQHGKCAFVLKLPGCKYDVGFDLQADGTYAPVLDTWANAIEGQIGVSHPSCELPKDHAEAEAMKAIGRLAQQYARFATVNAAVNSGYMVEGSTVDDKGNVHLTLVGM